MGEKEKGMIAGANGGNCVQRAISTMRLALGYETPLPENWRPGGKATRELVGALSDWFPGREIFIACLPVVIAGKTLPPSMKYLGTGFDWGVDVDLDEYLVAFTYKMDESHSHILIGTPAGLNDSLQVVFGVSLKGT